MWTGARRHPILWSAAAAGSLALVAVAAAGWYLLGEERRSGRLVSRVLSRQLGLPVLVDRARTEGPHRLVLRGLRVPPGPHWAGDLRVRELRVEGGIMPVVFPRGRALSVVAVSTSVTLAESAAPAEPPTAEALEAIRRTIMRVIEWPGAVSVRVEGGELRSGDKVVAFDLTGDKTAAGALGVMLSLSPAGSPAALVLKLAGQSAAGQVILRAGLEGEPARLGALWPPALPALARFSVEAEGRLPAGGDLRLTGRARAVRAGEGPPLSAEFAAAYQARQARIEVSRFALAAGEDLRLDGSGTLDLGAGARGATLRMAGVLAASPVALRLTYAEPSGAIAAEVDATSVDARRVLARVGLPAPPTEMTAARLRATVTGAIETPLSRLAVEATLAQVRFPALVPDAVFEAALDGGATLQRGGSGLALAGLAPTTLHLTRDGSRVAVITARSPAGSAWPLAVEAKLPDLRRLPSASSLPAVATGRAVVRGQLDRSRFQGMVEADLPRIEIRFARPIVMEHARAVVPVTWGAAPAEAPGTFAVERIEAYGFALHRIRSAARFGEGRLLLSDLEYTHYGGRGHGWIEAAADNRPLPLRARIEGDHIDLAQVVREYGLTVARLSGKVRYLLVLQHSTAHGMTAVGQVNSEDDGGEVGIDAIEKLLDSATVRAETTGVLRQTLESLRVFKYATLEADVRVTRDGGRVNLALQGKKRLGIFPPRVRAINFENVPITLLARTFSRKETP